MYFYEEDGVNYYSKPIRHHTRPHRTSRPSSNVNPIGLVTSECTNPLLRGRIVQSQSSIVGYNNQRRRKPGKADSCTRLCRMIIH